jgi:hypothetical protein
MNDRAAELHSDGAGGNFGSAPVWCSVFLRCGISYTTKFGIF